MTRTDLTFYQRRITERTRDVDARHVEAWIRLEHPTLDGLSAADFDDAIDEAMACISATTLTESEAVAASFGL